MPKHNDLDLYPLSSFIDGCRLNGSDENGNRAQFSFSALIGGIIGKLDVVHFQNATEAGQCVIGNSADQALTSAPTINSGGKFVGIIKNFPPTTNDDIDFLIRIQPR